MFEDQTVELLPARTVLTVFTGRPGNGGRKNKNGNHYGHDKGNGSSTRVDVDQTAKHTGDIKIIAPHGSVDVDDSNFNTGNQSNVEVEN